MASSAPTSPDCGSPSSEAGPYSRTPPGTHSKLPLTPPGSDKRRSAYNAPVTRALDSLRKHRDQRDALPPALSIELNRPQYNLLREELQRDSLLHNYVENKVRYDYDWEKKTLSIRMPGAVHEFFCEAFMQRISCWLLRISENPDSAGKFASQIKNGGSSDIDLMAEDDTSFPKQPDGQFQHAEVEYPGVVLEVSYSQDWDSLDRRAWQYIQGSNGDIKVVIGVEINQVGKLSTVSLWLPRIYRVEGDEQETIKVKLGINRDPFRSEDGTHKNSTKLLKLELKNFASAKFDGKSEPVLCIPYGDLAKMLDDAERRRDIRAPPKSVEYKRNLKKRKRRERPSPDRERILSDDEVRFQNEENQADERTAVEDGDYRPPRKRTQG